MIPHDIITSTANPRLREAARLREPQARRDSGLTPVDGGREVRRALAAGIPLVDLFLDESILARADAAGLAGVIACDARTDPANPAVIRASLGAVFSVKLSSADTAETIAWCSSAPRRVIAARPQGSIPWHQARLAGATAILLGSEAHGISPAWQEAADAGKIVLESVHLPMHGAADSLNVSATAAVLAYESLRQGQRD